VRPGATPCTISMALQVPSLTFLSYTRAHTPPALARVITLVVVLTLAFQPCRGEGSDATGRVQQKVLLFARHGPEQEELHLHLELGPHERRRSTLNANDPISSMGGAFIMYTKPIFCITPPSFIFSSPVRDWLTALLCAGILMKREVMERRV
jgi:hypothetical protein